MDGFFVAKFKKYADGRKKFNETLNEANENKAKHNNDGQRDAESIYDDELDRAILGCQKNIEKVENDEESSEYIIANEFEVDEVEIQELERKQTNKHVNKKEENKHVNKKRRK